VYPLTYIYKHVCKGREVPAEVQRGPRAPLSKKLTSPPHDEKILYPGGGDGLAQKNHHDVVCVRVDACVRDVGWRIEQ